MNEETVTIRVKLTEDSISEFQREVWKVKPYFYFIWLLLLLSIIAYVINILSVDIYVVGFAVTVTILFCIGFKKIITKISVNKIMQHEQLYTIKPDGLELKTQDIFSDAKWSSFYAFKETDKLFLVFTLRNQAYIIPKESFEGDDRKMELVRSYFSNLPLYKDNNPALRLYMVIILVLTLMLIARFLIK